MLNGARAWNSNRGRRPCVEAIVQEPRRQDGPTEAAGAEPEALSSARPPYVLEKQVGHLLRRAHQRASAIFAELIGEDRLTPLQYAVLVKVHDLGSVTQNRLGRLTAMDRATITGRGILKGKMKNYWDAGICPVDVRDVAMGHILAMEKGRIGESYALANKEANMTNREFLQLVGEIAGVKDVASKEVSAKVMLTVARVAEFISKFTGKAPITTYKNTLFALQHCYVDPSKAIEELGLPQTPIKIAITDSVAWFRENGYA